VKAADILHGDDDDLVRIVPVNPTVYPGKYMLVITSAALNIEAAPLQIYIPRQGYRPVWFERRDIERLLDTYDALVQQEQG
jgi:hypothetical protein